MHISALRDDTAFRLEYEDGDGDMITLASNEDLQIAIAGNKDLFLQLHVVIERSRFRLWGVYP